MKKTSTLRLCVSFYKARQHQYVTEAMSAEKSYFTPVILPVVLPKTTLLNLRDVTVGKKNQLIAAPCCYQVLGTLRFSVQNIKLLKGLSMRRWYQVLLWGFHIYPVEVINVSTLGAAFINYSDISSVVNTCRVLHQGKTVGTTAPSHFTQKPYVAPNIPY